MVTKSPNRYPGVTHITEEERDALDSLRGESLKVARAECDGHPCVIFGVDGMTGLEPVALLLDQESPLFGRVSPPADWIDSGEQEGIWREDAFATVAGDSAEDAADAFADDDDDDGGDDFAAILAQLAEMFGGDDDGDDDDDDGGRYADY